MLKNTLYLVILVITLFEMLFNSTLIINSVSYSFSLCINNLFPSLFPFMILSNILMEYGFVDIASELLKPLMNRLFKSHEYGSFVLILSIISGTPSNAKYINELLNKNMINEYDANKLLLFTHFVNPLFVINTIGVSFLHNKLLGIIILISHYLGNFIVGIIFRNYHKININSKINISKAVYSLDKKNNFINILTNSIISSINTLLIILGVITTCLIITALIDINPLLNGFLEITQGLKYISTTNLEILKKVILTTFLISFGGFSIHAQVFSILSNKKIKYIPYLLARVSHGIVSSIIVYILFTIKFL